jgi:predicted dehydrogenase
MTVRFGVVGLGGYAVHHHDQIEEEIKKGRASLAAVADIALDNHKERVAELKAAGVRVYSDALELIEKEKNNIDILTLPVGISAHAPLSIAAMRAGINVYVEKPPAATVDEVDEMIKTSEETGKFCVVGFQCQSMTHVRDVKSLLLSGVMGKVKTISCMASWPRDDVYYCRNDWAGQAFARGKWVLDGPMNNALAHQLMNLLFFGSDTLMGTASPLSVRAELYRARKNNTGEDTVSLAADLETGVRVFYHVTHASLEQFGPFFNIECSDGEVSGALFGEFKAVFADGAETQCFKYRQPMPIAAAIDFFTGKVKEPDCPVTRARNFTLTVNAAYESSETIREIPESFLVPGARSKEGNPTVAVKGMEDVITAAFAEKKTFSELGNVPWAVKTRPFNCEGYKKFTGARLRE